MDLNKVFVIGRVTDSVQLKSTSTGQSVSNFSVATNRVWKDKSGDKKESVEFHNIVAWGRQAEIASQFLTKGSLVMIEGRLQTRTWQGNDGQNRKTTEIVCESLQLGPRNSGGNGFTPSKKQEVDSKTDNSSKNDDTSFGDSLDDGIDSVAGSGLDEVKVNDSGDEIKPEDLPF